MYPFWNAARAILRSSVGRPCSGGANHETRSPIKRFFLFCFSKIRRFDTYLRQRQGSLIGVCSRWGEGGSGTILSFRRSPGMKREIGMYLNQINKQKVKRPAEEATESACNSIVYFYFYFIDHMKHVRLVNAFLPTFPPPSVAENRHTRHAVLSSGASSFLTSRQSRLGIYPARHFPASSEGQLTDCCHRNRTTGCDRLLL